MKPTDKSPAPKKTSPGNARQRAARVLLAFARGEATAADMKLATDELTTSTKALRESTKALRAATKLGK